MNYLSNLWVMASQMANTILLAGNPDQTISARAYVASYSGKRWPMLLINGVFFWQSNHCRESHNQDVENAVRVMNIERRIREL